MAYFNQDTVTAWSAKAEGYLAAHGYSVDDVKEGRTAWSIAHNCGITQEAYRDRNAVDAHIQTALEKIFPSAVFKDAKRY